MIRKTFIVLALAALSSAFAMPSFLFVNNAAMNGKTMKSGSAELIEVAVAPGFTLQARNITANRATFFYTSTKPTEDLERIVAFYAQGFVDAGWEASDGMMGEAMMDSKDGAMMDGKKEGAMMDGKKGDAMMDGKKSDAAMMDGKKDDAMMGKEGAMMSGKDHADLTLKGAGRVITISARVVGNRIEVDLDLK